MSLTLTNCGDTGSDAMAFFRSFSPGALFMPVFQGGVWKDTVQTSPVTASGDVIRAITDFSGNARHATSASAGASALWDATTYARPSAATNGSSTSYAIANSAGLVNTYVQAFVVASFEGSANAARQHVFGGTFGVGQPVLRIANLTDSSPGCWATATQGSGAGAVVDSTPPSGALELLEVRLSLNDRYIRVNQRSAVTGAAGAANAVAISTLFSANGGEPLLDGSIAFAYFHISASAYLTAPQVSSIRAYLGGMFGQAWS